MSEISVGKEESDALLAEPRGPWLPLVVVSLAQLLLVINVAAIKVSVDAIAEGLGTGANSVKTALIVYSLVVAGFVMLGARIGQRFGSRRVFRATLVILGNL